ncbi:MAG: nickel-responsive transcriptional regulator NikR [Candidatus Aminicenantes bacterium]|nr:nickel-responsive transcriptional regulator NikR [Candidatus Aminicenantes bacterium]
MGKTERFSVSMPSSLLERFDIFLREKGYNNRSEAIRDLIREKLIIDKEWECSREEVVGVLVIVYSLKTREISDKVHHHQHEYHKEIISTLHFHIDHDHCLEAIIIKGNSSRVKHIADELGTMKGVLFYRLIPATTGKFA